MAGRHGWQSTRSARSCGTRRRERDTTASGDANCGDGDGAAAVAAPGGGRTAEIGVFGGTGIYDHGLLEDAVEVEVDTPYGRPSDAVTVGLFQGRRVAFMPRHGRRHSIAPHMINYRANVWAFKSMGVTRILAPSAVGSLREEIEPGHLAAPDQFVDFTRTRAGSFASDGNVIHISVADPFCPEMREAAAEAARRAGLRMHPACTYVCIEGPRFSTRAESRMFRGLGADIIGMTLVPECQLAREAQICYASVSSVTDYDVWADRPVTAKEVVATLSANVERTRSLIAAAVAGMPAERRCGCASALADAQF